MNKIQCALFITMIVWSVIAQPYELGTHARMSRYAFEQSQLAEDPEFLLALGANELNVSDEVYYRTSLNGVENRDAAPFSLDDPIRPWAKGESFSAPAAWFIRGAVREDDHIRRQGACDVNAPNPQDEAPLIDRPIYHFFDPTAVDQSRAGAFNFDSAVNWGLGTSDALQVPVQPEPNRQNRFTLQDAREAQYRALTGLATNGDTAVGPNGESADTAIRNAYWATTFRILGDVVHLVEDIAQPQHTRNDPHSGACFEPFNSILLGHKSVYERYIGDRAVGKGFLLPSGQTVTTAPLTYTGYPIPRFDDYTSYFTTHHLDGGNLLSDRGLAAYSNRGFFSAGKMLNANGNLNVEGDRYAYPTENTPDYGVVSGSQNWAGGPIGNGATIDYLTLDVPDSLTGQPTNTRLVTKGAWDQFLEEKAFLSRYTLSRANYDDMAALLVPRAVAYSAGLIDYFFRVNPPYQSTGLAS